ncbi:MAG: PQQ-dependent sugar dehydrogenase [Verrucomicrobiota bacterium]|nr:PQQ-dependent sugar dehydrogenase [Verrucomicrobiota bacterium]
MQRGEKIYAEKCLLCHQAAGQGAPPIFPPLASSDWLTGDGSRAIRAVVEGLSGPIQVNGVVYDNAMPAQVLDDQQVADVLTYVSNSWGDQRGAFSASQVREVRGMTRFKTFDALVQASTYQPLPRPPRGFKVRTVAELPEFFTRMAGHRDARVVYLLSGPGGISTLDPASGAIVPIIKPADYHDFLRGDVVSLGMTLDRENRLWIVSNQKLNQGVEVNTNEVTIWRTTATVNGHPAKPEPWFRTSYPQGVGGFNHGVSHIAFGPDGLLYLSSGSRTDGGEGSKKPRFFPGGEVDLTACLWRLDPKAEKPELEIYARGIRNAYGFAWDSRGQLFTFSNGPDYDAGEEMDAIERGRHYGFPYQYENWEAKPGFPYPHTPAPPDGAAFTPPVVNAGPDGGFKKEPSRTFDPHSSPGGTIWCGDDFPEPVRNGFLMPRFGNLLAKQDDAGFDVLAVHPQKQPDGTWQARVQRVLAPLGRPLDLLQIGTGRVLILEYTRPTDFKSRLGWLPGRIIELAAEQER